MKNSKFIICIVLGVFFWFVAAMSVRFSGNYVFTENGSYKIMMFAILFPVSYLFIFISQKTAKLEKSEILNAVVIMTITATFLDGIALNWFTQIYAETYEVSHYGAAWILSGVGVGLLTAYFMNVKNDEGKLEK